MSLTVPETRKALQGLRSDWKQHGTVSPIDLSVSVDTQQQRVGEFAFLFVLGRHRATARSAPARSENVREKSSDPTASEKKVSGAE
jgi:hypothetical protein